MKSPMFHKGHAQVMGRCLLPMFLLGVFTMGRVSAKVTDADLLELYDSIEGNSDTVSLSSTTDGEECYERQSGFTWRYEIEDVILTRMNPRTEEETTSCKGSFVRILGVDPAPVGRLVIPGSLAGLPVMSIGVAAFAGERELTSVSFPRSLRMIESDAFSDCIALTDVTIPESVILVDGNVFAGCSCLTGIMVARNSKYYQSVDGLLCDKLGSTLIAYPCSRSIVAIPDGIRSIGSGAFAGNARLTSLHIPVGVTNVQSAAFRNCPNLAAITVAPDNPVFCVHDDMLMTRDLTHVVVLPSVLAREDVILPDTVTSISGSAFRDCRYLRSIRLPSGVKTLNSQLFENCSSLTNVTFSMPTRVRSVGSYVFRGCSSLREIDFPSSVSVVGAGLFDGCVSLVSVSFANGVKKIGNYAFRDCRSLTVFEAGPMLTEIGHFAFDGCSSLARVDVLEPPPAEELSKKKPSYPGCNLKKIGPGAFRGCASLTDICLPTLLRRLEKLVFSGCSSLRDIVFSQKLTSIGTGAFRGCSSLENIVFPEKISSVGTEAFADCTGLQTVVFLPRIYYVYNRAFAGCTSLSHVVFMGRCPITGEDVFKDTPEDLVTEVPSDSMGWPIGHVWQGRRIAWVTPDGTEVEPRFVIKVPEVVGPWMIDHAVTVSGGLFDESWNVLGRVVVTVGRPGKGGCSVACSMTGLDGKNHKLRAKMNKVDFPAAPVDLEFTDSIHGDVVIRLGTDADGLPAFVGRSGPGTIFSIAERAVPDGDLMFVLPNGLKLNLEGGLTDVGPSPHGETVSVRRGRWSCGKATSLNWYWDLGYWDYTVQGRHEDDTLDGLNLSSLRLAVASKKGTFRGSFKVYVAPLWMNAKVKTLTASVTGVIIAGRAYGQASIKNVGTGLVRIE